MINAGVMRKIFYWRWTVSYGLKERLYFEIRLVCWSKWKELQKEWDGIPKWWIMRMVHLFQKRSCMPSSGTGLQVTTAQAHSDTGMEVLFQDFSWHNGSNYDFYLGYKLSSLNISQHICFILVNVEL